MTQKNYATGKSREIRPPFLQSSPLAAGTGDHHKGGYPSGGPTCDKADEAAKAMAGRPQLHVLI